MKVFIASPFSGDIVRNIQRAQHYCRMAIKEGHTPFAPHLFFPQLLDEDKPEERTLGIQMGLEFLNLCSEMWVFGDPTPGMKEEIIYAVKHQIPIRYFSAEGGEDDD